MLEIVYDAISRFHSFVQYVSRCETLESELFKHPTELDIKLFEHVHSRVHIPDKILMYSWNSKDYSQWIRRLCFLRLCILIVFPLDGKHTFETIDENFTIPGLVQRAKLQRSDDFRIAMLRKFSWKYMTYRDTLSRG